MDIIYGLERLNRPPKSSVMTLGNFDGVHLGHQRLLGEVARRAARQGLASLVLTFDPHPARVLSPENPPLLITTLERRLQMIASLGVDLTLVMKFTSDLSLLSAREFVEKVLIGKLSPQSVLVGYNFSFGKNREGTPELLKKMGEELGFDVQIIEPVILRGGAVSSSRIREALQEGGVAEAKEMLGCPFEISGVVVKGKGLGKGLGFPTANLAWDNELLPKNGVYACLVERGGSVHKGVVNIGTAPTIKGGGLSVEAYILDFSGEVYGDRIKLLFIDRLREERRFEGAAALREQIERDVERGREILR